MELWRLPNLEKVSRWRNFAEVRGHQWTLKDGVGTAMDCSLQEGTPRQGPSILFKEPLSHFSPSFAKNSSGGDAGQDISEFFCC